MRGYLLLKLKLLKMSITFSWTSGFNNLNINTTLDGRQCQVNLQFRMEASNMSFSKIEADGPDLL